MLIGKPDTAEASGKIETLLEQLRLRQLVARADRDLSSSNRPAAEKLQALKMAQAQAEKQTELTNSHVQIEIAENHGEAELAQARKQAEQTVVTAEAENKRQLLWPRPKGTLARAAGRRPEQAEVSLEGEAEADVLRQKIASYGDPRLYALSLVAQHLSQSQQPLVPERLFVTGGGRRRRQRPARDCWARS